jgi:Na+/H+ antiporter NhaD/arsenite permease-like protein
VLQIPPLFPIIFVLGIFLAIPVIYSKSKWDLPAISILLCMLACIVTAVYFDIPSIQFVEFVHFKPLLYMIAMSIIIIIVESQNVFQAVAIKIIKITQSNPRRLFYFMCMTGMIFSSIVEDMSVALIFIPLVIKACKVLRINSKPFILGIALCLNLGNMVAPFSNSQNIILADSFGLTIAWFGANMIPFVLITTIITIVIVDFLVLKKQPQPTEQQKRLLNELMEVNLLIIDRRLFIINAGVFLSIIVCFFLIPDIYIVALIGAAILCLINKTEFVVNITKIDWKVIIFFIVLFLIMGCMLINGTLDWLGLQLLNLTGNNVFLTALMVLISSSIVASILSPNPTTIFFIPLLQTMFEFSPVLSLYSTVIIFALISGLNVGNFFPQGAPCYLVTINIAETQRIMDVNYRYFAKQGAGFTIVHIAITIGYIVFLCLILGVPL